MAEMTIVNYEQLQALTKKFADEGEAIAEVLTSLRQRVHDLQSEWIGLGSEAFFDEMETIVLPSLQRLHEALVFTAETSRSILKIYRDAEDEAAAPFKGDLESINLGTTDFGASAFVASGFSVGAGGGVDLGTTDFGASQFGAAGSGGSGGGVNLGTTDFGTGQFGAGGSGGGELGSTDFGAESFREAGSMAGTGQSFSGGIPEGSLGADIASGAGSSAGGEGGGAGGGPSSGIQGDLSGLGTGLGSQTPAAAGFTSGGAGGPGAMPDFIYSSQSAVPAGEAVASGQGGAGPAESPTGQSEQAASGASAGGIAGAVGGAGAVAGAAAKAAKKKKEQS